MAKTFEQLGYPILNPRRGWATEGGFNIIFNMIRHDNEDAQVRLFQRWAHDGGTLL